MSLFTASHPAALHPRGPGLPHRALLCGRPPRGHHDGGWRRHHVCAEERLVPGQDTQAGPAEAPPLHREPRASPLNLPSSIGRSLSCLHELLFSYDYAHISLFLSLFLHPRPPPLSSNPAWSRCVRTAMWAGCSPRRTRRWAARCGTTRCAAACPSPRPSSRSWGEPQSSGPTLVFLLF